MSANVPPDKPHHFQPFTPDEAKLPELTWQAVGLGALLGIVLAHRRCTSRSRSA